jgi:hypothetical protein
LLVVAVEWKWGQPGAGRQGRFNRIWVDQPSLA